MAFKPADRLTAEKLNREIGRLERPAPWAGPGLVGGETNGAPFIERAGHPIIPRGYNRGGGAGFSLKTVATFADLAGTSDTAPSIRYVIDEGVLYGLSSRGWTPLSEYLPWSGP